MGFCIDPSHVEVNVFRAKGKWYITEEMVWLGYGGGLFQEFCDSAAASGLLRFSDDDWLVCLEPYNKNSFPIMMQIKDVKEMVGKNNGF